MRNSGSSKLTLLLGPAGAGKTHRALAELGREIEQSKDPLKQDLIFILPTVEHRARTVDLLLRSGIKGFFGKHVTTFDEVLSSYLKLGGINFASDVTRRLILKDLIARTEFQYFKEASQTNGFVDLTAKFFAELKESLIGTKNFKELADLLKSEFGFSGSKYDELSGLYESYESRLAQENLKDRHDALFLLEEGLKRGRWNIPRLRHVWIDGFFNFSRLQLAFIRFLSTHSDQVTVTLTLDVENPRRALFDTVLKTKEALLQLGFKTTSIKSEDQRTGEETLGYIERNLFSENPAQRIKPGEKIQIFEAAGLTGELEMIAREIKRIVTETNMNYSDIALIFRQVGPYLGAVGNVFSKYEIPVEIHEREKLKLHPLAGTLTSLMRIVLDDWKRDDLFNFLKSAYVRSNREAVYQMEINSLKEGWVSGRGKWLEKFPSDELARLAELEDRMLAAKSVSEFSDAIEFALRDFGMDDLPESLNEQNQRDHAALNRIRLLLLEIRRKYRNSMLAPKDLAQILIYLIEVDLFSFHHRDKNKVQIYNIALARQKEYKVVFLPGLLEKQFPLQVREDPILSDAERRLVNRKEEILPERLPRQSVERLFFYLAVTRASERLILSFPRFDLEGKEALPSFYIDEVKSLFDGELAVQKQNIGDVLAPLAQSMRTEEAAAQVIDSFWQAAHHPQDSKTHVSVYNSLVGENWFHWLTFRLLTPIEGKITDARIKDFFRPKNDLYTPSRLEIYAECAYRFFADQLLRLENDEEKIDPRVIGNILHEVLEQFHIWAKQKGIENLTIDESRSHCEKLLEQAIQNNPLAGDRWYRIELKKLELRQTLFRILEQEIVEKTTPLPGLTPQYFEYEFGKDDKEPALVLETEEGDIKFRGKIDRIDVDGAGKFGLVIDYKTGKPFSTKSLNQNTQLQLPLYLLAMQQNLKLEPLGAHLYTLNTGKSTGFHHKDNLDKAGIDTNKRNKLSAKEWGALFDRLTYFMSRYVRGIQDAEIPVKPRDCVHFCAYSSLCRIEKWRLDYVYREIREEDAKLSKEKVAT